VNSPVNDWQWAGWRQRAQGEGWQINC
jgi:hypothetical protein